MTGPLISLIQREEGSEKEREIRGISISEGGRGKEERGYSKPYPL